MHQEKNSLTWHTYSDHLKSMMKDLMMNEDFSDVTLVTEDKKHITANIHILSACSPVFKDILKKQKNSSPSIYLRGIQSSEIESILQFIYLGEATFFKERMDEFLAVARSLEIEELCNAKTDTTNLHDDKLSLNDPETSDIRQMREKTSIADYLTKQAPVERRIEVVEGNRSYECEPCQKTYSKQSNLTAHIKSKHEGVKYACDHCDRQFPVKGTLTKHIQAKHEGIEYPCVQCDFRTRWQAALKTHINRAHGDCPRENYLIG